MVPDHITSEATKAMSRCSKIYSIVREPVRLWLPTRMLGKIEVVNALDSYVEGALRSENYDRLANSILDDIDESRTIGYVTYGNPMFYDRVAQDLAMRAKGLGITTKVVPGISSLDTVLCDLNLDVAPFIQIFEASWMVACQIRPRSDIPVLLMQIGAFGSLRTHYTQRQDGSSLEELVEHLSPLYPSSHTAYLVHSTGKEGQPTGICPAHLADLCHVTAEQLGGASLYIPAVIDIQPNPSIITRMSER